MSEPPKTAGNDQSYRYWAFISYNSNDVNSARWLHRAIETYGIPAQLAGNHTPVGEPAPKRFYPVFKDREEMPVAPDLTAHVVSALRESRYLIVLCSPNAAASKWVNKEVETFISLGRKDRILAFIVDGDPPDCFPPALRQDEPIAADARSKADGKNNAKLKLLAGMLGVTFDALKQRDAQRRIRRLQFALALVAALVVAFAALAWYANHQRSLANISERRAIEALANSDFREGISRLRQPETTSEGIAFLARAARIVGRQGRAHVRLWSLLQQRRFWVETPVSGAALSNARPSDATTVDPRFATVEYKGQRMKPSWFSRSADGHTCVTIVNDEPGSWEIHHFRVWRSNGTPITPWTKVSYRDHDVRDLISAHLSSDGRFVAVVAHVWREPQVITVWHTNPLWVIGEHIPATGREPNFQGASFTQVRFLPPPKGDPTQTLLLTASSRGDSTLFEVQNQTLERVGRCQHATSVQAVAVDDEASWLMSASADRQVMVWDLADNRLLGNPIALPVDPQGIGRVGPDRIRVVMAGPRMIEYKLLSALSVPPPTGGIFRSHAFGDESESSERSLQGLRGVALLPTNTVIDRSSDGSLAVRMLHPSDIEAVRVHTDGSEAPVWRRRLASPVWRARFEGKGSLLIVQTDSFTNRSSRFQQRPTRRHSNRRNPNLWD